MGDNGDIGWIDEDNTHVFARFIQEYTGYKTFEIVADTEWPTDYYEMVALGNQQRQEDARPTIKYPLNVDLSHYSTIFIGSGVWGGQCPMIMRTFYETYSSQLRGKHIYGFGTHEGSGISTLVCNMRTYLPGANIDNNYLGIYGHEIRSSRERVNQWLASLGITSSIKNVNAQNATHSNVHSLDGRLVKSNIDNETISEELTKGIYIVGGKKVIRYKNFLSHNVTKPL